MARWVFRRPVLGFYAMRIGSFAALWVDFARGIPIFDLLTRNQKSVEFYWNVVHLKGFLGSPRCILTK